MVKLYQRHSNTEFVNHYFGEFSGYFTAKIWFPDNICFYAALPPNRYTAPMQGNCRAACSIWLQNLLQTVITSQTY